MKSVYIILIKDIFSAVKRLFASKKKMCLPNIYTVHTYYVNKSFILDPINHNESFDSTNIFLIKTHQFATRGLYSPPRSCVRYVLLWMEALYCNGSQPRSWRPPNTACFPCLLNPAVLNSSVTSYISFCEDMCIPTRTHLTYNNDKSWFTAKLRQLCQVK